MRYISGLIALINEQSAAADAGSPALSPAVEAHYHNTLGEANRYFKSCLFLLSVWLQLVCFVGTLPNHCLCLPVSLSLVDYIRGRQQAPDTSEKFAEIALE